MSIEKLISLRQQIIKKDFSRMNDMQLEAVLSTKGPLLVLAGAGSGKTTVLVNRIVNLVKYGEAYYSSDFSRPIREGDEALLENYLAGDTSLFEAEDLLSVRPAKPWQILAITFTNKAAGELKERICKALGEDGNDVWASTFHSTCDKILRRHADEIGYTHNFTIYDSDDSKRAAKECIKRLGYDEKMIPVKSVLAEISRAKDELITPAEFISTNQADIRLKKIGEVYEEYQHGGAVPTLRVLREKFLEQEEPEAQDLALVSELFTNGSLDAFAHESNVDVNNRIMVYDILDLGKQLKTMGLLVITDAMLNRVTENWKQGKRTHIFLDEFHVVFENEYSGAFFNSAWRRFRKRNAFPTAITQNVEYLLDSVLASTMISNSEYIVMLNQAEPDRAKLATLLNISTEQMGYITNADAGCGLVKYGSSLVPFVNRFPTNTRLYKLMTTKPGEDSINRGRM